MVVRETYQVNARKLMKVDRWVRLSGSRDLQKSSILRGQVGRKIQLAAYPWAQMNVITSM